MKSKIFAILLFVLILFSSAPAFAAKKRVWTSSAPVVSNPTVSAFLSRDRKTVTVNFSGLKSVLSTSYELTYTGNELDQGVYGSIKSGEAGNTASRSMYLGTCSYRVCTAHKNVKNARLVVTFKLKNGKETVKSFRLKI